jgi:hypothetical protein
MSSWLDRKSDWAFFSWMHKFTADIHSNLAEVSNAAFAMLVAGNYRCVQADAMRPIKDAVHSDLEATRTVYNWVVKLCVSLGASEKDMVPFEKYANAALSLGSPSSAARALAAGAPNIERVDLLVKTIAGQKGQQLAELDHTVTLVEGWLEKNRKKA